ncbi:hypothetical protein NC653_029732 [Populus alba x Populus x berolinensis]|uniref:Uncharacterized protein n=1 Tax=Populus alba x Populus x berolinensis TaxID=444605 RepID=A0AAD6M386_9ROSI|nr:hypothetical protein NC653_029732 [Populus alba x Populus x berolinensis]
MPFEERILVISHQGDVPLDDPFSVDIKRLTAGMEGCGCQVVHVLISKGVNVVPFKLNSPVGKDHDGERNTVDTEMLAHFDDTRQDDLYEEAQDQWPTELRHARVIPAVDYVQVGPWHDKANGCRAVLPWAFAIAVPTGFKSIASPPSEGTRRRTTIATGIYARPNHEHIALALAMASQSVTDHHKQHPPIDNLGPNDGIPDPPTLIITESFLIKIFCILTLLLCGSDEVPIISYYLIKFFNQSRSYYCGRAMKLQWMK